MEGKISSSDGEDIPSDFFDDFTKDDFIEGLSVIDSWENDEKNPKNSRADNLDGVRDLRQLIARDRKEEVTRQNDSTERNSARGQPHLDDFISPGSRRDPSKTQEAIKKDKELKVKEYLTKHLESSDDLRPPGTELDDFYEDTKSVKRSEKILEEQPRVEKKSSQERRVSPRKFRREPRKYSPPERSHSRFLKPQGRNFYHSAKFRDSPGRFYENQKRYPESPGRFHESPGRFRESPGRLRESPGRYRESPGRFRESPGKYRDFQGRHVFGRRHESPTRSDRRMFPGPRRRSPKPYRYMHTRHEVHHPSRSPQHFPGYRKDRRYSSPHGSPSRSKRERSPKSPEKQYRRSYSRSPRKKTKDDFLYPDDIPTANYANNAGLKMEHKPQYPGPIPVNFFPPGSAIAPAGPPMVPQSYNLPPAPAYTGYNVPFEYANQPPLVIHPPQPVPAPIFPATSNPAVGPVLKAPQLISPVPIKAVTPKIGALVEPMDPLAKLVADGKLSHEDYLKLAPNKGMIQQMDTNTRLGVLNRCHSAMSKLGDLLPPNRLLLDNIKKEEPPKSIQPKFCSPLKKNPTVEFNFTKVCASSNALQNKRVIDSIISTLELHKIVGCPKKNLLNNVRNVAVQTSNPQCDVCAIRKATLVNEAGTSIDPEHFSSTTHTQVVEEDLQTSKPVFAPSSSVPVGAPISFAHMTPAQLVSQLGACAKTLKKSEAQANRYDNRGNYDGRGNTPKFRNNYSNYRY